MDLVNYNGKTIEVNAPVFTTTNRGYRYGDGFFETMRLVNGKFPLKDLHIKRIERSIATLRYIHPKADIENIFELAIELSRVNNCKTSARVRLSFFNGHGNVFDENAPLEFLIETSPLSEKFNYLNGKGLTTGICPDVRKSCDVYSNLKSANYLFSRLAAEFAKENNWNDALILNSNKNICESTIANVFWVIDGKIYTTPLSEGCVAGVMRDYLINKSSVIEKICVPEDLLESDEIFLTNAISGLRWVKNFDGKEFQKKISERIYVDFIATLWVS